MLATNSGWTEAPFLEVLSRSGQSWWKFWARRPSVEEVKMALVMLRYRRNSRVVAIVTGFKDHANDDIAAAARALLDD